MSNEPKKGKADKPRQPRGGKPISFESAIFIFGLLNAGADQTAIERGIKLALRSSDLIGSALKAWLASRGVNVDELMAGEPTNPTSKAEVIEFVGPFLERGAEMATLAQIADIYLFGKERTPENIVYAFYIGTRFVRTREREPTAEEAKDIWDVALWVARNSNIGARQWKELESKGPIYLKDWIDERKEDARKRYETFLNQKKRAEATAEKALNSLMVDMFGGGEDPA